MIEEIGYTANDLGIKGEEVLLLKNIVGSHHGFVKQGWGSVTDPVTAESIVLHQIDMIDAGLDTLKKALCQTEKGEFTRKLFSLNNCSFYNHKL